MGENLTIFLLSVGVVSGITGFLALLLSIAQNTIGNYGDQKVIINGEKEVIVDGGSSLLSGLVENEIFIPSACGGKGSCGYCKCKVTSGGGDILPTETGLVTKEEAAEGFRLSCQLKVKEELKIEIPEEYLSLKQYQTKVIALDNVTDIIRHVTLQLPEGEAINFKPGQYIQLLAPEYEGNDEEVYRAYSIASTNSWKDRIQLFIGYVPEGVATTYVHHHLNVGDEATIIGPFGHFFYQEESKREMLLIGNNTGLAPLMSIIRYMRENKIDRKATLYTNVKNTQELYIVDELEETKKELPNFDFVVGMDSVPDGVKWDGYVGFATDLIKENHNVSECEAYLCGSPFVLDILVKMLTENGMPEERIYYDKFQ